MRADQLYLTINAGRTSRYKIRNNASKHFRHELVGGYVTMVCYCAEGSTVPDARSVIELTDEDALKMSHMDLLLLDQKEEPAPVVELSEEARHFIASSTFRFVRPMPSPPQPPVRQSRFEPRRQGSVAYGFAVFCLISGTMFLVLTVIIPLR